MEPPRAIRLQLLLARAGVGSRRRCEEIIRSGRVTVSGRRVTDPAHPVVPGQEPVAVDGRPLHLQPPVYILLYKPKGLISAARDPFGRPSVVDHVRRTGGPRLRLYPVGRLDCDSEGLLLLTNDGQLAYHLTHPSRGVPKTYRVWVAGAVGAEAVRRLRHGVHLEDGVTGPAVVRVLHSAPRGSVLELTLREGRKRQVRRMCEAVGHPVRRLLRVRIGPLALRGLRPGEWRYLSPAELEALRRPAQAGPRQARR